MTKYSNEKGLPLSVAVWLATDHYNGPPADSKKYISATGLLKSIRQITLLSRLPKDSSAKDDLNNMVASRFGTALHDSIEKAWTVNMEQALGDIGYPQQVISRVRLNPEDPNEPDIIPVYMEQRFTKEVGDWSVSGQFDFVGDGRLEDFKSTSTYAWVNNNKDQDYIDQGSIYRWGRPDIITEDMMAIQFIFKDWQRFKVSDPKYPSNMIKEKVLPLKPIAETDLWIKNKLALIDKYADATEAQLPLCTDKELWRDATVWKYYKDPTKTSGRSTKNFDSPAEANLRFVQDGSVGIVVEVKAQPKACKYCSALSICSQGQSYIKSGELKP